MVITIPYKPRELARKVHECTAKYITLVAHRRFGKSYILFNEGQKRALKKKGRYAIVGPYFEQVRSIYDKGGIIDKFLVKEYAKVNQNDLTIRYANGSVFEFIGSENYDRHRGAQYDWLGMDESDDHRPEAWDRVFKYTIMAQADGSFTGGDVLFAGTLKGTRFLWGQYNRKSDNRASFMFRASETGLLSAQDIEEIRLECDGDESVLNQELECVPMYYSGLIFKEYGEHNILKPFTIPHDWSYLYGLDHGANNPTAVGKMRVDHEGNVYMVGEYYKPKLTVYDHAPAILDLLHSPDAEIYADPSIWNDNLQDMKIVENKVVPRRFSVVDEYRDHGITGLVKGQNSVLAGINRMREYLRFDPERIHPLTGKKGSPKFFIIEGECPYFEKEVKTYRWQEKKSISNDPDSPVKLDDHILDAIRYALMSRPDNTLEKVPTNKTNIQKILGAHLHKNNDDDDEDSFEFGGAGLDMWNN